MYRMRLSIHVLVEVEGKNSDEAFAKAVRIRKELGVLRVEEGKVIDSEIGVILKEEVIN